MACFEDFQAVQAYVAQQIWNSVARKKCKSPLYKIRHFGSKNLENSEKVDTDLIWRKNAAKWNPKNLEFA